MFYLILLINQNIEGKEYAQSTVAYPNIEEAKTQYHVALASYRQKETTIKVTALIVNDEGERLAKEVFVAPVKAVEDEPIEDVVE